MLASYNQILWQLLLYLLEYLFVACVFFIMRLQQLLLYVRLSCLRLCYVSSNMSRPLISCTYSNHFTISSKTGLELEG
jgi:hypothetical protein